VGCDVGITFLLNLETAMSEISDLNLHPSTDWRVKHEIKALQKAVKNNWDWAEKVTHPDLIEKFLNQSIEAQAKLDKLVNYWSS